MVSVLRENPHALSLEKEEKKVSTTSKVESGVHIGQTSITQRDTGIINHRGQIDLGLIYQWSNTD
jgi:hypothetical protein